ncbi:unnamed protein product [Rhizopus stolonifer]
MTISILDQDCLQLIFELCDGCPWTLCTIASVCRQWYFISRRSSVWRNLVLDKPMRYSCYTRLLESKHPLLHKITHLKVSKPNKHRHAHFTPLPFENLSSVAHLETENLCLAEIEYLSHQLNPKLLSIVCGNIETWCDTKRFCFDLVYVHPHLQTAYMDFAEDGNSGFAPMVELAKIAVNVPDIKKFALTSIRDGHNRVQKDIMNKIEKTENDVDMHYIDPEFIREKREKLLRIWNELENAIVEKYIPLAKLKHLTHLAFGFCTSWTPKVWTECFLPLASSELRHLSLHGWDQLGKMGKFGCQSSTIQSIRFEAENAIADCFESMTNLQSLQLVDFSIGSGLLQASIKMDQIVYLDIMFTDLYVKFFTGPFDVWLLTEPLEEFILNVFREKKADKRHVCIRLHPKLFTEIERSKPFEEPFLLNIKNALQQANTSLVFVPLHSN